EHGGARGREPADDAAVGSARAPVRPAGERARGSAQRSGDRRHGMTDVSDADRERLKELRDEIARTDDELVRLLARRLSLAKEIGEIKTRLGIPVLDPAREAEVVRRAAADA